MPGHKHEDLILIGTDIVKGGRLERQAKINFYANYVQDKKRKQDKRKQEAREQMVTDAYNLED